MFGLGLDMNMEQLCSLTLSWSQGPCLRLVLGEKVYIPWRTAWPSWEHKISFQMAGLLLFPPQKVLCKNSSDYGLSPAQAPMRPSMANLT